VGLSDPKNHQFISSKWNHGPALGVPTTNQCVVGNFGDIGRNGKNKAGLLCYSGAYPPRFWGFARSLFDLRHWAGWR
jgi:hypothetical protein